MLLSGVNILVKDRKCYHTEKLWNLIKLQMVCNQGVVAN